MVRTLHLSSSIYLKAIIKEQWLLTYALTFPLQHAAKEAAYFFKCPLCNDTKVFLPAMRSNGVYVPEQYVPLLDWEEVRAKRRKQLFEFQTNITGTQPGKLSRVRFRNLLSRTRNAMLSPVFVRMARILTTRPTSMLRNASSD
jgi:hypothetical protein